MKQTESKTAFEQFTVVKRGVIYARVSTDEQARDGTSLDNQVDESLKYAQAKGIHIPPEFIFREDFSGKTLERPELDKVRALLKAGAADALIIYKTNRQDRSDWGINYLIFLQELKSWGVEFHKSETGRQIDLQDDTQILIEGIEGWQAGKDRKDTVEKLTKGKRKKVEQGSPIVYSRPPYGYISAKAGKEWRLEILEPQAQVVRFIYHWYVFGDETTPPMSSRAIAKRLNQMGIPSRGDVDNHFTRKRSGWSHSTIDYLLRCETYAGTFYYGKRNNPKSQWIAVEVPAIVGREVWNLAQEKKKEGKDRSKRNTQFEYLLRRQVTCSHCHYKATVRVSNRFGKLFPYYCCCARSVGVKCDMVYYPAKKVDDAVWNWLEEILTSPDKLLQGLREYQELQASKASPIREEMAMIEGLIAEQETELKATIANMNAVSTPRAKAIIGQDIERIEGVLDGLEKRRDSLQEKLQETTLTDEQFMSITQFTQEIAKKLPQARKDFNKRRQLVEILNVTGEMVIENGEKILNVTAVFGTIKQRLSIVDSTTVGSNSNQLTITARLVIK